MFVQQQPLLEHAPVAVEISKQFVKEVINVLVAIKLFKLEKSKIKIVRLGFSVVCSLRRRTASTG